MAISEELCWEVLKGLHGSAVSATWLKGEHSPDPPLQNAMPRSEIERDLVLRHTRTQIDDSLYFLEKRGYLIRHGFEGLTRVALQLSDSAIAVLETGAFSSDEQTAFRDAMMNMTKPEVWGLTLDLRELWRRFGKAITWFGSTRSPRSGAHRD